MRDAAATSVSCPGIGPRNHSVASHQDVTYWSVRLHDQREGRHQQASRSASPRPQSGHLDPYASESTLPRYPCPRPCSGRHPRYGSPHRHQRALAVDHPGPRDPRSRRHRRMVQSPPRLALRDPTNPARPPRSDPPDHRKVCNEDPHRCSNNLRLLQQPDNSGGPRLSRQRRQLGSQMPPVRPCLHRVVL